MTPGRPISVFAMVEVACRDCGAPAREATWVPVAALKAGRLVATDLGNVRCDACRRRRLDHARWVADAKRQAAGLPADPGPRPEGA
jgi:hypothetical protein